MIAPSGSPRPGSGWLRALRRVGARPGLDCGSPRGAFRCRGAVCLFGSETRCSGAAAKGGGTFQGFRDSRILESSSGIYAAFPWGCGGGAREKVNLCMSEGFSAILCGHSQAMPVRPSPGLQIDCSSRPKAIASGSTLGRLTGSTSPFFSRTRTLRPSRSRSTMASSATQCDRWICIPG